MLTYCQLHLFCTQIFVFKGAKFLVLSHQVRKGEVEDLLQLLHFIYKEDYPKHRPKAQDIITALPLI